MRLKQLFHALETTVSYVWNNCFIRLKQWSGHWLNCIGGDLILNSRLSDCSVGISIIVWLLCGSAEPQDGSSAHRPKEWIPHVFSWIWETDSSTLVVEKLASYNQLVISCFLISILFLDFIDGVSTRSCGGKGIVDDGKGRKKFLISGYMTEITCVVHYRTYKKMTARGKSLAVIISCCEITSEKWVLPSQLLRSESCPHGATSPKRDKVPCRS